MNITLEELEYAILKGEALLLPLDGEIGGMIRELNLNACEAIRLEAKRIIADKELELLLG